MAILKDPAPLPYADLVFLESTYGDLDHRSLKDTLLEGEAVIRQAVREKGKILIPSFAVGRTQQLLYYLAAAFHKGDVTLHLLGGLSAHAGQSDLLRWFNSVAPCRPRLVLSHGEEKGRKPLADIISNRYGISATLPEYGEVIEI
jgi:predicted metal-dependent RNase